MGEGHLFGGRLEVSRLEERQHFRLFGGVLSFCPVRNCAGSTGIGIFLWRDGYGNKVL